MSALCRLCSTSPNRTSTQKGLIIPRKHFWGSEIRQMAPTFGPFSPARTSAPRAVPVRLLLQGCRARALRRDLEEWEGSKPRVASWLHGFGGKDASPHVCPMCSTGVEERAKDVNSVGPSRDFVLAWIRALGRSPVQACRLPPQTTDPDQLKSPPRDLKRYPSNLQHERHSKMKAVSCLPNGSEELCRTQRNGTELWVFV